MLFLTALYYRKQQKILLLGTIEADELRLQPAYGKD